MEYKDVKQNIAADNMAEIIWLRKIIRGNKLGQGIVFAGIIWGKTEYSRV